MTTYRPDITPDHQREEEIDDFETFNGNTCFKTIDLTNFGNRFAASEIQAGRAVPTPEAVGTALADEIKRLADECGPNARMKLQIMYHYGAKPIYGNPDPNYWQQQISILTALELLKQRSESRLTKLILAGCWSNIRDRQLVDIALGMDGMTHVVTMGDIIFLAPGTVSGGDGNFRERKVDVTVWQKGENGEEQIGRKAEIDDDEQLDLQTMTVQERGQPPIGACPTSHTVSGSGRTRVGSMSKKAAGNRIIQLSGVAVGQEFSRGTARNEALDKMDDFSCPNPQCTNTTLTDLRVTETYAIETTILRWFFGSWIVYCDYSWSADFTCD